MIEFYSQIKWVHVAAVLCSGAIFLLRGLLVHRRQQRVALAAPVRYFSYTVDTVLLTAALTLLSILPGALFANGWLITKLVLLVVYGGLGTFALKRGRTPRVRTLCTIAALLVYVSMIGIARMHHPLGWLLYVLHRAVLISSCSVVELSVDIDDEPQAPRVQVIGHAKTSRILASAALTKHLDLAGAHQRLQRRRIDTQASRNQRGIDLPRSAIGHPLSCFTIVCTPPPLNVSVKRFVRATHTDRDQAVALPATKS